MKEVRMLKNGGAKVIYSIGGYEHPNEPFSEMVRERRCVNFTNIL
jgi:hypothetical protein